MTHVAVISREGRAANILSGNRIRRQHWWIDFDRKSTSCFARFIEALLERDGGRCQYCGVSFSVVGGVREDRWREGWVETKVGASPQADHITPRCKGGLTTINNLVLACTKCNSRKSGKWPSGEWVPRRWKEGIAVALTNYTFWPPVFRRRELPTYKNT